MDCKELSEFLDAYALGAAEKPEAEAIERHAADCVRCWEELNKSQRTAAMLALAVPVHEAPLSVEQRLMAAVQHGRRRGPRARLGAVLARLRLDWRAAAWAVGAAGIAALGLSTFLQMELEDLRDDKRRLERQAQEASLALERQNHMVSVLSATDSQRVLIEPMDSGWDASVVYNWSRSLAKGFLVCEGLPAPESGKVYRVWFTGDSENYAAESFVPEDGACQVPMDLSVLRSRPEGIGISVEDPAAGAARPGEWLMYTSFR